jgi:Chaperone of endosialidase
MAEQPKMHTFGNMEAHENQPRTEPRYLEPLTASEDHALRYERAFFIAQRSSILATITVLVLALGGASSWGGPNTIPSDGNQNTAGGDFALQNSFNGSAGSGSGNSAFGYEALSANNGGNNNTAIGIDALKSNKTGIENTAIGGFALVSNTGGDGNTANGTFALNNNTTGNVNTATGDRALESNTTGSSNTASGYQALASNIDGINNIAVGVNAGFNLKSGNSNIYLGNIGVATDSKTMRLGQASNQTRTFIAGIFGQSLPTASGGSQVLINSAGRLGTVVSAARYKQDIQTMGENSQGLHQLRPVTFRYKQDAQGVRQYGLIAEEVAKVYPELVVRGPKGEVESVQYHQLIPMLLNELQHQQHALIAQSAELAELKAQNRRLEAALMQQNTAVAARVAQLEAGATRATAEARR